METLDSERHHAAARVIQRAWHSHELKLTYWRFRDLISFRAIGEPIALLRTINPREAQLLDAAAGVHVKFRLGGDCWPPNIYYRIYTHRPVQDLCANSPRDYTNISWKQPSASEVHNKGREIVDDRSGWYRRWENNGWRLIGERELVRASQDFVTRESSQKRVPMHHDRVQRREELERKRREKKIKWMRKLYTQGLVQVNQSIVHPLEVDADSSAVSKTGEGIVRQKGDFADKELTLTDGVDEVEVEKLLTWSADLDFDQYVQDWCAFGTSGPSDAACFQTT